VWWQQQPRATAGFNFYSLNILGIFIDTTHQKKLEAVCSSFPARESRCLALKVCPSWCTKREQFIEQIESHDMVGGETG
jgi:hypothetical protein